MPCAESLSSRVAAACRGAILRVQAQAEREAKRLRMEEEKAEREEVRKKERVSGGWCSRGHGWRCGP